MAAYRFANPNRSSFVGTVGEALNRAAGSVDNIAIAMMRNQKTPEERALAAAHQASFDAQARKLTAEADAQEIANQNMRDPLGAIAQAVIGGDRDTARTIMGNALRFQDNNMEGPPQYADVLPQVRRDVRSLTLANATDPKSIAKVMERVLQEQQLGGLQSGQLKPQDVLVNNFVTGGTSNKPFDIQQGLRLEAGSGNVSDTSVSRASNARDYAAANASNASANANNAHAGLYKAETDNEIAGKPGRTGGGRGVAGGEKSETAAQRMAREAKNAETMRARQRIQDLIESGMSLSEIRAEKKDSAVGRDIMAGNRALVGEDDPGYADFSKLFDGSENAKTVADAVKAAQELGAVPGALWGSKYNDAEIKAEVRKQFPSLTPEEVSNVMAQRKTAAAAPKLPSAGTPAQQAATAQQAALPQQAASRLREGVQTKFSNGQVWTLQNGQPTRVQ